ncbi:serine protease [Corynebacterium cystitidis]|uniref:serine protease n=1 Tax=Corynebacterium cystitidis TaxID=35757 RepID=UPI00211DEF04|nr:serine protease [Corynebacterium cystitidis]
MRDGDSLSYRKCMANYLRNNMWLTARHCVSPDGSTNGFVQVGDDSKYALQNVYIPNEGVDLALVETSPVGELQGFELPSRRLNLGEIAYLAQYNRDYPYFESVPVTVTKYLDDHSFPIAEGKSETVRYSGLYEAESVTDSQPCIGDSGGAIFVGKSIYAIHTGGGKAVGVLKLR